MDFRSLRWVARGNHGSRGFSLVELMTAIAISGIIASIAFPTFARYKTRAKVSEAYVHLGAMFKGVNAYYQADHWHEGVVSSGKVGGTGFGRSVQGTSCLVMNASTSNVPTSEKTVLDWSSESPVFEAINFQPTEPLLYNYTVGVALGTGNSSYAGGNCSMGVNQWWAGCCGHPANLTAGNYQVEARGRPNDEAVVTSLIWGMCSNENNGLYVCFRRIGPEQSPCSVTGAVGAEGADPASGWLLALFGCVLAVRRRRPPPGRIKRL